MGRKRSERTGGIWHMHPQQGELVQAEIEFFNEELIGVEPQNVSESYDLTGLSE